MSTPTLPLAVARSLAHPATDPPTLVARVREALGWQGSDFLVGLAGYDELMATLDVASDLEAIVRIGDPTSPPLRLLRALNAADPAVRLVRVTAVPAPWRWTRLGGGAGDAEGVALRQQTYSDVVAAMGRAGVAFRVLPDDTTTEELLAIGAELGSAVVDVDELRPEDLLIVGFLELQPDLTYGLLSRDHAVSVAAGERAQVWLSMSAAQESAGTLMTALERISALGIDLDFLHSDPVPQAGGAGGDTARHHFHLGFRSDLAVLPQLQADLAAVGFASRVLATFGPV